MANTPGVGVSPSIRNTVIAILAGGAIVAGLTVSNYIDFTGIASPASPAASIARMYAKTDTRLYRTDSNGTEAELVLSRALAEDGVVATFSDFIGTSGVLKIKSSPTPEISTMTGEIRANDLVSKQSFRFYGATGDGVADDTAEVQAAFDAAIAIVDGGDTPKGRTVCDGGGIYKITGTITIANVEGLVFKGSGSQTIFSWAGNATDPMFKLQNNLNCQYIHFRVSSSAAFPLAEAFRVEAGNANPPISAKNHFQNISINGTTSAGLGIGFRFPIGAGGDNNNDFHSFQEVNVENYSNAGWSMEATQEHEYQFMNCRTEGGQYGVRGDVLAAGGGNFTWYGGFLGGHSISAFRLGSASGLVTSIHNASSEGCNRLLLAPASGTVYPCVIEGVRFATDALNADGEAIEFHSPGPLVIRNCKIGSDYTKAVKIDWNFIAGANPSFQFQDNVVIGSSNTVSAIFTGIAPTCIIGSNWQTADLTAGFIGDRQVRLKNGIQVNTPGTGDGAADSLFAATGSSQKALVVQGAVSPSVPPFQVQASNGGSRVSLGMIAVDDSFGGISFANGALMNHLIEPMIYSNGSNMFINVLTANTISMRVNNVQLAEVNSTGVKLGTESTTTGTLQFANSASANLTTLKAGNATAAVDYTLPPAAPTINGQVLSATTGGAMSWTSGAGTNDTLIATAYTGLGSPSEVNPASTLIKVFEAGNGSDKGIVTSFICPSEIDLTTTNPEVEVHYIVTAAGAGNANVVIRLNGQYVTPGQLVDIAAEDVLSNTVATINTVKQLHATTFTLDRTKMAAGDEIIIDINRFGSNAVTDLFTGSIGFFREVRFKYKAQ